MVNKPYVSIGFAFRAFVTLMWILAHAACMVILETLCMVRILTATGAAV